MRGNARGTQLALTYSRDRHWHRSSVPNTFNSKLLMSHRGDIIISSFNRSHFNSVWNERLFKISVAMKTMGGKCKDIWRSVQSWIWLHKELPNASFFSCKKIHTLWTVNSVTKGSFTALWHHRRSIVYTSKNFLYQDTSSFLLRTGTVNRLKVLMLFFLDIFKFHLILAKYFYPT